MNNDIGLRFQQIVREGMATKVVTAQEVAKDAKEFSNLSRTPNEQREYLQSLIDKYSKRMELTLPSALQFVKDLEEEKIKINVCEINGGSHILKLVNRERIQKFSASPTDVEFSTLVAKMVKGRLKLPIALKIFHNFHNNTYEQGMIYEYKMYKMITDVILKRKVCPNFIPYVAFGCCPTTIPDADICYLITEKAGNGAQFDKHKEFPVVALGKLYKDLDVQQKSEVIFQVIYALTSLQRFEISHNDLHLGNILVMILDEPVVLQFVTELATYSVQTRHIPYIYDWDHGFHTILGKNVVLKNFEQVYNISDQYDGLRDIYTLFCLLGKIETEHPKQVMSYANHPVTKAKESGERYKISYDRYQNLLNFTKPNRQAKEGFIYKLSSAEYNSLFAPLRAPEDTKIVYFYVREDFDKTIYIYLWNAFVCRIASTGTDFQTPEEVLYTFDMFETTNPPQTKFVYRLPTKKEALQYLKEFRQTLDGYVEEEVNIPINNDLLELSDGICKVKPQITLDQLQSWIDMNKNIWNSITKLVYNRSVSTNLPDLPINLKVLESVGGSLVQLPELPNTLVELYCDQNEIKELPKLPNSLEKLSCQMNKLTSLPALDMTKLKQLVCSYNRLTSLPTLPQGLVKLICSRNKITELPSLPDSLQVLRCEDNLIKKLPPLPKDLVVEAGGNPIELGN